MALWLGYRRVSHVGARAGDRFHSPDEQADVIRAWVKPRGDQLELLPPELDESGARADRPLLTAAVERVERGEACGIVVAYLSRASRSVRHLLELWDRIEAAGGQVVAVAENIDTSTPSGRLTRTMLAAIAEHELDLHRDRFENLRRSATERGIWQRRQTPRGYERDEATRRLVPDDQADEVRAAFRARGARESPVHIARRLGMTPTGVRRLLCNRVYLGELSVGHHVNPVAHEPLVDVDTWEAAQRTVSRPGRSKRPPALLAGLVRCAGCGHLLTRGGSSRRLVYVCPTNHSGAFCPAPAAVTVALLDSHVEAIALKELARLSVSGSEGKAADRARANLTAAERELAAYLEAVSAADVGAEAFAAGAKPRRHAVEIAQDEIQVELGRQSVIPFAGSGAEAWTQLDGAERNALLRALIAAVIVRRAGGRGAKSALHDRVRVLAHGSSIRLPIRRGGEASGIVPIALPDMDDPRVLGVPTSNDVREQSRGNGEVRRGNRDERLAA